MEEIEEEVEGHFSHHHPLVRSKSTPSGTIICSGCNLKILSGKDYYRCKICPFFLHQVCYNMPRKTRHPGHPAHYLNLLVTPPSAKGTFKHCKACSQHVTGFYYSCAECGICYHNLCSALPLSVVIHSHSHTLKLEFSLPYDFECDLCQEPGYKGWLYRCQLCEFDTHLGCAIMNRRIQSLQHQFAPFPNPLTTQIMYSSASSLMETHRKIDYASESNELMQLVVQGIRETVRQKTGGFQIRQDIAAVSPDPGEQLERLDHSTLLSGDTSTLPSYQFSDSCFSIDIARSYPSYDQINPENDEPRAGQNNPKVFQDTKNMIILRNDSMLDRITSNLEPGKQEKIGPSFSFHYKGSETNRLNEHSRQNKIKKQNATRSSSGIKDQCSISDTGNSKYSCCSKLFHCFYHQEFEKDTINFKDGRT